MAQAYSNTEGSDTVVKLSHVLRPSRLTWNDHNGQIYAVSLDGSGPALTSRAVASHLRLAQMVVFGILGLAEALRATRTLIARLEASTGHLILPSVIGLVLWLRGNHCERYGNAAMDIIPYSGRCWCDVWILFVV